MLRFHAIYVLSFLMLSFLLMEWIVANPCLGDTNEQALFQKKCCACHDIAKSAPPIGPVKFAAIQWERFFAREKHKRIKNIDDLITKEEQMLILQYLKDHAADSDRPIAAGMR